MKSINIKFIKTNNSPLIKTYRIQFYKHLTAPIDAMWEKLYIASSQHFLIQKENQNIGYCCISENKNLLQIFLKSECNYKMAVVIQLLTDSKLIASASLSSQESISFNACLFHAKSITTNTFCFQHLNQAIEVNTPLNLTLVSQEEISIIKAFLKEQVAMDDTFGYTQNLVNRKEIYRIREGDTIIAISECRLSDTQPDYADLGVIVNKDYRGQRLATKILKTQVNRVLKMGRKPICSTTHGNIASKKAIERAGFYCSHIIFDMNFG